MVCEPQQYHLPETTAAAIMVAKKMALAKSIKMYLTIFVTTTCIYMLLYQYHITRQPMTEIIKQHKTTATTTAATTATSTTPSKTKANDYHSDGYNGMSRLGHANEANGYGYYEPSNPWQSLKLFLWPLERHPMPAYGTGSATATGGGSDGTGDVVPAVVVPLVGSYATESSATEHAVRSGNKIINSKIATTTTTTTTGTATSTNATTIKPIVTPTAKTATQATNLTQQQQHKKITKPTTKSRPTITTTPTTPLSLRANIRRKFQAASEPPPLYIITPTYRRPEQLAELTRLGYTLKHVVNLLWLVIEDAHNTSDLVTRTLNRIGVPYEYLTAPMPEVHKKSKKSKPRGVSNRNRGLEWLRANATDGVFYFADDDNTYDITIFEQMRYTTKVSMFPVGLVTDFGVSTPIVRDGKIDGFYDGWIAGRKYAVDMAGFAVSVKFLLERPKAHMTYKPGYEEDDFLKSLAPLANQEIELLANNCTEILTWHTQTRKHKDGTPLNMTKYHDTNLVYIDKLLVRS